MTPPAPPELRTIATPVRDDAPAKPSYDEPIATRKAFGEALAWLAATFPDVVVLDGEVGNSTYTEDAEAVATWDPARIPVVRIKAVVDV